ncbi:IclR family transcriptional regulator [Enemella sp. A6]|uniref:IclR family transcriptional regulator n=1 Tax=Enemella sp. A6 TaxID=3440152 RepID=UPI003EB849D4
MSTTNSATTGSSGRDQRGAIDKAVALLRAFADQSASGLGVRELARLTGMSKSTAFRILATLEANDLVERAGTKYRLGPLIQDLQAPDATPEVAAARDALTPYLAHLYERTRSTVHLAILRGTEVSYLNKLHGLHQVISASRVGGRVPSYCTAVGKALLAWHPEVAAEVMAGEMPAWTANTITDPIDLRAELATIRDTGIAHDRAEITEGLYCVAAPVLAGGTAVAALSISGLPESGPTEQQLDALTRVCRSAGRAYQARWRERR